jgi:hypothetical protein
MPTGTPLATGTETTMGTKMAVAKAAATSANALSNTQALVGSRRGSLARSFMTRRYRSPASTTSTHM